MGGAKLSKVPNCPRGQIVLGANLSKVPNCPMKVLNCPRSIDIWGSVIWGLDIWGLDVQGQMFNLGPEHPILDIGG